MVQIWEIVGGADKGGILVKPERLNSSKALAERLSTGALVEEIELVGDRLNYKLTTGTGPETGWITIQLPDKALAVRRDDAPADDAPADDAPADVGGEQPKDVLGDASEGEIPKLFRRREIGKPATVSAELAKKVAKSCRTVDLNAMSDLQEKLGKEFKGIHFGMKFPHTVEQLEKAPAKWFTDAFHAAGTIPKDNKIKRLVRVTPFNHQGAAAKAILEVQYENDDPNLHTELFAKFSYSDTRLRFANLSQGGLDGAEVAVQRWVVPLLPFPVPRYYFSDVSLENGDYLLVTEKLNYGTELPKGPYELFPELPKTIMQRDIPVPITSFYYAIIRRMAQMCAAAQTGRFGGQLEELFGGAGSGYSRIGGGASLLSSDGVIDVNRWKMSSAQVKTCIEFHSKTAAVLTPPEQRSEKYMEQWGKDVLHVILYLPELEAYQYAKPEYRALCHPNMNIDNAFFWKNATGDIDAGLVDFGSCKVGAFGNILSGSLFALETTMMTEHQDSLAAWFYKVHQEEGGLKIDENEVKLRLRLAQAGMNATMPGSLMQQTRALKKKEWMEVTGWDDPRVWMTGVRQSIEFLARWESLKLYPAFRDWLAREGLPEKKPPA